MAVVNKVKQIDQVQVGQLIALAHKDDKKTDHDVAKWIIAHSPHWRSQGYSRIISEIQKHIEGEVINERS